MERYKVITYDVGQGLFNLLKIFDENKSCKFCGIFDCGTIYYDKGDEKKNPRRAIDAAAKEIRGADRLDVVVISHQDDDHWNYLGELLTTVNGKSIKNGQWYNSEYYFRIEKYQSYSILEEYEEEFKEPDEYRCTYRSAQYDVMLTRRVTDTRVTWDITAGSDGINKCLSILGEFRGDYLYFKEVKALMSKIYSGSWTIDSIRLPLLSVLSDLSVGGREGLCNIIIETLKYSMDFDEEVLEEAEEWEVNYFPLMFLGGTLPKLGYRFLGDVLSFYGYVEHRDKELLLLSCDEYRFFPLELDDAASMNRNQSFYLPEIQRNATSLITLFEVENVGGFLFPGDATIHTFGYLLQQLYAASKQIIYITAPHHGSFNTNIVVNKNGIVKPKSPQPVISFFDIMKPRIVAISARHEKYGHPNAEVVEFMERNAIESLTSPASHQIIECHLDSDKEAEEIETELNDEVLYRPSEKSIFTTETSADIVFEEGHIIIGRSRVEVKAEGRLLPLDSLFICRGGVKL